MQIFDQESPKRQSKQKPTSNFLMSKPLIGSLVAKSRLKSATNNRNHRHHATQQPTKAQSQQFCDLKIDLLVDFKSLMTDALHWQRNLATPIESRTHHIFSTFVNKPPTQESHSYRYCSLKENLSSQNNSQYQRRQRYSKSKDQKQVVQTQEATPTKQQPSNNTTAKNSIVSAFNNFQLLKTRKISLQPTTKLIQVQNRSANYKIQIPISENTNIVSPSRLTVERGDHILDDSIQANQQNKRDSTRVQLPITIKTKIADSQFQSKVQTLPLSGQQDQNISIQCSEGDLMSQLEIKESAVKRMFGVSTKQRSYNQTISQANMKARVGKALKLKLINPFNVQSSQAQQSYHKRQIQISAPLKLSKDLHRYSPETPISQQLQLENFQTILFSRRFKNNQ